MSLIYGALDDDEVTKPRSAAECAAGPCDCDPHIETCGQCAPYLNTTKPQEPVAWKGLSDVQWMNIVNHDSCYLNQDKEDAVHLAVKLTEARLKGNNTTPQPCPKCSEGLVSVTKEDANNYCRIVTLLGMEEEGSPVDGVEYLISLRDGMTCGDCNDTGWLENREEGRYPCTCMTEAEPYQILEAECDALAMQNQQMREALTLWKIASDNSEEVEFDEMAAYSIPMPLFCDADEATEAALVLPDNTEAIIKRHDSAIREEMIDLFRLKHRDYANELAAELEGKS